jgi:type III pantothenate kinase
VRTLVLSIGNTSVFGGVFSNGKCDATFRLPVSKVSTGPGFARLLRRRVRGKIDRVAFCSVVPKLTALIAKEVQHQFGLVPRLLTAASLHGLKIAYRNPRELGTDRIAAALGARQILGERNAIVVDCGTATTVTALHRDGVILGGAIFPGLALWPGMLVSCTAQLPAVALRRPRRVLGRSTRDGLQSGIFHGHAGAIRELVRKVRQEAFGRGRAIVIGTGGNMKWLGRDRLFSRSVPNLALLGLEQFGTMDAPIRL